MGRYLLKSVTLMPPLHTHPHLCAKTPAEEADWTDAAPYIYFQKFQKRNLPAANHPKTREGESKCVSKQST